MSKTARGAGRRAKGQAPDTRPAAHGKPDTKLLLIETAQRLFGQHGLDGISLREIAAAAGQANSNAVQYHFNDKAGLIRAILDHHVSDFETLRKAQLDALPRAKSQRVRALLKILWLPGMSVVADDGSHPYCRFLLQYMIHPHNVPHPVVQFYTVAATAREQPALEHLMKATRMLRELYATLPPSVLDRRIATLTMMFLATVVEHDNRRLFGKRKQSTPFDAEPVLDMAIAALGAPADT